MPKSKKFQVLHISDLHVNTEQNFDRSVVLDPLLERAKADYEKGLKPEIVVVTGDIAYKGVKKEYAAAKEFFDRLLKCLGLGQNRIFLIPGNHDVNRKKYRPKDIPAYDNAQELNTELENPEYRDDLFKGLTDYFEFVKINYPHLKAMDNNLVPFVHVYKAECGKKIGIVGLNSAWMCRKSPDEREIAVGEYQIKIAMEALARLGKTHLRLNLLHHPLSWLWPEDVSRCRGYYNSRVLLTGHLHDSAGGWSRDLDGELYQFQAGGLYLGSEANWPARFHYITFDWEENLIQLDFRSFVKAQRKWSLDASVGDDGCKRFEMMTAEKRKTTPSSKKKARTAAPVKLPRPGTYFKWIDENFGHVDADKLYGKGQAFPLSLPEIFIPLYAHEPEQKPEKMRGPGEKQEPVNLEELIARSDSLVIAGHAGSGKTTLLKHLTYQLAKENGGDIPASEIKGFLPLLIMLKDLHGFFSAFDKVPKAVKAEELLAWYLAGPMDSVLSMETLGQYSKAGKVLLLIDGLDELSPQSRELAVKALADWRIRNDGCRIIFTGRPHGIDGTVVKRLGKRQATILPLNMAQVETFIRKWFAYLYPGSTGIGNKNALAMINEIRVHPAIDNLIGNPLMLTAICILYHDGKELPGQRAELYKKFIDNLLYRRFDDSTKVHTYLRALAFQMHTHRLRAVDRDFAVRVLGEVYKQQADEPEKDFRQRLSDIFNDLEPKSGLLKCEGGQYNFWHLTFQEFLAADHIVDNYSDRIKAVEPYWNDDWHREMLELYIGYLSIEQKQTANDLITYAVAGKDKSPFRRWRLAAWAMLDIHKDRRIDSVVEQTRQRLLEIVEKEKEPQVLADSGEALGWLGDPRDLRAFVKIEGGVYELEEIGRVELAPFQLGKYPVTNKWYEEFKEQGRGYDSREFWSPEGWKWLQATATRQPGYWDDRKWKCPNAPVVGICWYEADAFCRWLTMTRRDGFCYRLPTEKEWQAAAAGKEGRAFPWGNKWHKKACNNSEIELNKTSAVGVFKTGQTHEGVFDLIGNVEEWTKSDYHARIERDDFYFDPVFLKLWHENKIQEYFNLRNEKERPIPVLRGGSWVDGSNNCRCAARLLNHTDFWYFFVGFRCARI